MNLCMTLRELGYSGFGLLSQNHNVEVRKAFWLANSPYIAVDPDTGAGLLRSHGQRKDGTVTYYLSRPGQNAHRFKAASDAEALEHGRRYLARLAQKVAKEATP